MKKYLGILSILLLAGAGCADDKATPLDVSTDIKETTCIYEDQKLTIGESFNDGCNTHTCQKDGTVVSTEIACEAMD